MDYREFDQSETSVRKLSEFYLKGGKFLFCGRTFDPFEISVVRVYSTEKTSRDYLSEVWQVGLDVTRDFITSPPTKPQTALMRSSGKKLLSKNIFIVHGRDHEPVRELKAMLSEFGLKPIVLYEQASGSMTIAEKIEKYLDDVGYAFVILTPDDLGCFKDSCSKLIQKCLIEEGESEDSRKKKWKLFFLQMQSMLRNRARQNVILEFGCCWGKLGRKKVCCLHKGDVDFPSDMQGIVYIPFKESVNEARDMIMMELNEAGYEIRF